jgi:hypothetical protein
MDGRQPRWINSGSGAARRRKLRSAIRATALPKQTPKPDPRALRARTLGQLLVSTFPADGARRTTHHRLGDAAPLLDCLIIGAVPAVGDRSEPALLARGLEAEPPVGELRRDEGARESLFSPIDTPSPLGGIGSIFVIDASLGEPPLGGCGMHLPYVPGLSVLVGESSVGQTGSCGVGFPSLAAKILPARSSRSFCQPWGYYW